MPFFISGGNTTKAMEYQCPRQGVSATKVDNDHDDCFLSLSNLFIK